MSGMYIGMTGMLMVFAWCPLLWVLWY